MEANRKKTQVHRLPTEDITNIGENTEGEIIYSDQKESTFHSNVVMQHLYFTTEEEVKEDDWFIDGGVLFKAYKENFKDSEGQDILNIPNEPMGDFAKIIATTDPKLTRYLTKRGLKEMEMADDAGNPYPKKPVGWYNSLPQPSQAFIRDYCEQGGIDEVYVEYETIHADRAPNGFETLLKVDQHNTITTHRIVEKMYSRKKLEQFFNYTRDRRVYLDTNGCIEHKLPRSTIEGMLNIFDDWIKENL